MAEFTRVNGFGNYTTGTIRSVAQLSAFLITVKNASASAQDLRSEDDGAEEVMEAVIREVQPLMYFAPSTTAGTIHVIVDGHAVDATTLQIRLRALGTAVGPNAVDVSGTTVAAASAIALS